MPAAEEVALRARRAADAAAPGPLKHTSPALLLATNAFLCNR